MTVTADATRAPMETARSPAEVERAPTLLAEVPRPVGDSTVVPLTSVTAGGLEAVHAEWGLEGGEVVLTGKRPFVDLTGRAGFRADGTLDGSVQMRAAIAILGMPLGEATWSVAGWAPESALLAPTARLQGTKVRVDLAGLPREAAFTPAAALNATTDGTATTVELPGDALPQGEPLSPRYAELFRGLLGTDVSGLTVHADSPVAGAPAFVSDTELFFAPGVYGVDSPDALQVLDAAIRAALAGLFGTVGAEPAAPPTPPAPEGEAGPAADTTVVDANVPAASGETAPAADAEAAGGAGAEAEAGPAGAAGGGGAPAAEEAPEGEAGADEGEAAPAVEVLMPEAPTEPTPAAAARGGAVAGGAGGAASAARDLPTADENTADARGAVTEPASETAARAREEVAAELGEVPPPSPEIVELTERIRTAIRENRPEDEDELIATDPTQQAQNAGATITGSVETQSNEVAGAYDAMASPPSGSPALTPTPVAAPDASSPGMGVDAASAAPDPIPDENISLDADVAATDQRIADSGIETRVTAEIPDGPFQATRDARGELGELAARTPEEIRAEEQTAIDTAQADMANLQLQAVAAMRAARGRTVGETTGASGAMTGTEEVTRDNVSQRAQGIYDQAQRDVEALLTPLSRTAMARWDAELARHSREFHDALDAVQRWIDDRHSGVIGTLVAIGDYVAGLPGWVIDEYNRAERQFGDGVCDTLLSISSDVNAVIASAQGIIRQARDDINGLFDQMEAEFPEFVATERARFAGMLDGLATRVTEAQTSFVRDVSTRAITAVNEAHATVQAKREEAGGLIGRVVAAIAEFIDDPVRAIINGLLRLVGIPPGAFWSLIAQIEQVISDIADNPENFINNLQAGVKQGFSQFFDNFGTHLIGAFWNWLFSSLKTPIPMPSSFDPLSLVTFALQLMGITWPNVREILVRHLGPEAVELLEIAWQIISTLISQGPQGLVNMIKEQLSPENIVGMILDAAIDFIVEKLIVKAAEYIFSLLNPAGAVAQAIMLIYRVCSWIFRNAARIFAFVQAVVGGIANVIAGNIGGLAAVVERALASMLVVVIDLFMGLLGLGDLPDEVAGVIQRMQAYVLGVIDTIVGFLVTQARALLRRIGIGGDEDEEDDEHHNEDDELGTTVRFSGGRESHRLFVQRAGDDATIMVASTPTPVEARIAEWRGRHNAGEPDDPQQYAEADGALSAAEGLLGEASAEADALAADFLRAEADRNDDVEPPSDDSLENRERALATAIGRLFDIFEGGDKTEQWLREMGEYLPGEAQTAMDSPYRDWALRIPEFTIGNQPDDERIWGVGVLDGTRSGAETFIAADSTHRMFLPYFQADARNRRVKTAAFSDYVFTGGGPMSTRMSFRKGYGDAAVARLQTAATWTIQPSTRVDQDYKDRLLARLNRMRFEPGAPGGGRIEFPTERIPDHTRYRPVNIVETEGGGVRTITYSTVTGQTYTSTVNSNNGLSMSVTGENLRFMTGRGVTQDSPAFTVNNGFDRSHIIANEFGGSGYAAGGNLITASSEYNQTHMRGIERRIGDSIAVFANANGRGVTEVSFTMTVTVSFGALRDPAALAEAKALLDAQGIRPGADLDAEIVQKINAGQVHPDLLRITGIVYTWTFTDPAGGTHSDQIGADLWLLTQG
ncbi:hypothetical protein [Demequina sp.]|uniref:hypothetical protein n=1 Tax=Demequina sp. TaxID=2050685 RepID=UPI003D12F0E9